MTAAPPNAALPFNKMFVMLPVMLAARQLDGEDAHIVYLVRVAYAAMQTLCVVAVVWTFFRARSVRDSTTIVYVPVAPQVSRVFVCCFAEFVRLSSHTLVAVVHHTYFLYLLASCHQPFADPNAKKKYTEIAYGQQVYTAARSLLTSTLFSVAFTCGT
jgi:Phosphate transport (Pho88)